MTLLDHLLRLYPTAKRTTLRRMIESRRVTINGRPARTLKQDVQEDDTVKVVDPRTVEKSGEAERLPFSVVFEDPDILVIDKPPGLITSTGPREKRPTALAIVRRYVLSREAKAQVGLIHRLDRDASGLLIFSKNHASYLALKRQFFEHSVERIYLAGVHGVPNPRAGMIDSRLVERADGSVRSTDEPGRGERAITHYETVSQAKKKALLRVRLQTGKKHQIRAHLAERGVSILNDPIYSDDKPTGRLMLVAVELHLSHPRNGKPMAFKIDPPAELIRNFE